MSIDGIQGRAFSFAKGLETLDPFEGYQLVRKHGGIPVETSGNAAKSATEVFVVADALADGTEDRAYVAEARAKGALVIGETTFWQALGKNPPTPGVADHWVLVDTRMESAMNAWEGKLKRALDQGALDVGLRGVVSEITTWARSNAITENSPAWDGSVAPYTLFIQSGTAKSTSSGAWNIVSCGFLAQDDVFAENENAAPWFGWRNDVGRVIVQDRYAPRSCEFLFDGLQRCTKYELRGLDTSNVTSMRAMFRGSSSAKDFMFAGRFDTSKVTDMREMFFGCINAELVDCRGWDFSKVTNVEWMFENSPAVVLCDGDGFPLPEQTKRNRMFETAPKMGSWLCRAN